MFKAYRSYFDFRGRASRSEFWLFYLWLILAALALALGDNIVLSATGSQPLNLAFGAAFLVLWATSVIPFTAVAVRRLHDSNRSG